MRGLLAIEPLFHQIVKGLKTQTRRSGGLELVNKAPDEWESKYNWISTKELVLQVQGKPYRGGRVLRDKVNDKDYFFAHRYKIGEVLYIKEPVSINADRNKSFYYYDLPPDHDYRDRKFFRWPNKLFMPASAARHFIKITGVKCERLLDISDEDCIAEGIEQKGEWTGKPIWRNYQVNNTVKQYWADPKLSFISLFKFANKMKSDAKIPNMWVWAYTFEYLPNYKI